MALIIVLLLAGIAAAQDLEVIGKSYVVVESPFELQAPTTHQIYQWGSTPGLTIRDNESRASIAGPPGKYEIRCKVYTITLQEEAPGFRLTPQVYRKVVQIGASETPEPGEPTPDKPTPGEPLPDLSALTDQCERLADALADSATAALLAGELQHAVEQNDKALDIATARVTQAIRTALLNRKGNSRTKDWLGGWRAPLAASIEKLGIQTAGQYRSVITALITGLKRSNQKRATVSRLLLGRTGDVRTHSVRAAQAWTPPVRIIQTRPTYSWPVTYPQFQQPA